MNYKLEKIIKNILRESNSTQCPAGYTAIKTRKVSGKEVVDADILANLNNSKQEYCVWCNVCYKKKSTSTRSDDECDKSPCTGVDTDKTQKYEVIKKDDIEIEIEPEPEKKKEYVYVPSEEELRAKEEARLKKEFDEFVKKKGLNFSCGEFTGFSKGCVNEYVEKLRKCLNKHPNYTPLPIDQPREKGIDPNYIWDDDLENRFNEIFPDKKGQSQSKSEINQICLDIDAIVEKLKQSDNKNDNSIIDTPVQDIKNTDKKLQFKDIPESRVITKKRLIKEIDEKKEQLNRDLVYMKSLNTTYKYCLPKWFSNTKVQSLDERVVIVGVKKWPDNQTTDDPKPELDGATYYVDTDLNMHRYDDTGILATQQIFCSSLVKSKANFDERAKYKILLQLFNVNSTLKESDFLTAVNKITSDINKMVDIGYKSDRFTEWKNFLDSYFKNKEGLTPLTTKPFFYANLPETDKQNYVEDSDNVSKNVGWNIIIYKDKSTIDYVKPDESITVEQCRQSLSLYLRDAIVVTSKTGTAKLSETQKRNKATDIFSCKGLNRYNKNDLYYEKDVLEGGYDTIEKSPFVKIGNPLKYSQIVDYLSGKDREGFFGKDREYTGKYLIRPNVYILDKLNESFGLNDKIKLTLNEIVLEKRKVILQEKVIRNRVDILFENQNFDSRKKRREFVLSLLKEALYIESQGFNKQIINEEFWDVVKGFFGDEGSQSVFKSFKTRMSEWLTSHLTPKKADGWIGNCIRKTIKDIDIEDVHLITDCKYLTRKISRSIVEKLDEKMNNNELKDEGLYDIVRGGMSNNVKSAKFRTHIEEKVSKMICPILNDMSTKFDETFEKMKKRALDVFD